MPQIIKIIYVQSLKYLSKKIKHNVKFIIITGNPFTVNDFVISYAKKIIIFAHMIFTY